MLTILVGLGVLLPLALLRRALRLGLSVQRQRRQWRMAPLPQRNMTRATFGGFVVALAIGFAATGIPFRNPVATWALAGIGGLGLLYLAVGVIGSQGAVRDWLSVFWWSVGAFGCLAALLHFEGMI